MIDDAAADATPATETTTAFIDPETDTDAQVDADPTDTLAAPDGEEAATSDEPLYTLTIDGEEQQLSKSEVEKAILRRADYTRKTQEVAEERRQLKADREALPQALAAERAALKARIEAFTIAGEEEPDWAKLADANPAEYVRTKARWDVRQRQVAEAQEVYTQIIQAEHNAVLQREFQKLIEVEPKWADEKIRTADFSNIAKAAEAYGMTQAELAGITDHKHWLVLRDAAAFRALQSQKPAIEKKVTDVARTMAKSGTQPPQLQAANQLSALKAKAKASGSLEDAANAIRFADKLKAKQNGTANQRV